MECANSPTAPLLALKSDLFCDYDASALPQGHDANGTAVFVRLVLQFLQFWESEDTLRLHVWMDFDWTDARLSWDPASHSGLTSLTVDKHLLWFPDIMLYSSSRTEHSQPVPRNLSCTVRHGGNVSCTAQTVISGKCRADVRRWPFDAHRCSLSVGSQAHSHSEIQLQLPHEPILLYRFQQSRQWHLVKINARRPSQGAEYSWLEYDVHLERHAQGYFTVVVVPALALAAMTLLTLWVEPECSERIIMSGLNIAGHVLFMQYAMHLVPSNADQPPLVFRFYLDSLVLAILTTVTSVVTYALTTRKSALPTYLARCTQSFAGNIVGKFILPEEFKSKEDGAEEEIDEEQTRSKSNTPIEWRMLATMVDRMVFAMYVFIIVILMHRFIV
ncbi:neuronal acetylcholine receptor subunit alpha-10-like [Bacillus rossius redtenbacheri]|uniref:neuronal acetylcholine receptor subunit alpha-10-like n=1 Tax=Bacillus rossius redtenbacheri TaxID=93214 RepID=UPI002FDEB017